MHGDPESLPAGRFVVCRVFFRGVGFEGGDGFSDLGGEWCRLGGSGLSMHEVWLSRRR